MSIPLENVPRQYVRRDGRQWVAPLLALGADERGFVASLKGAVAATIVGGQIAYRNASC